MKILKVEDLLKQMDSLSEEIRYKGCADGPGFSAGLIAFRPTKESDSKQIRHGDKDVLCHVLKGRGRLRINGEDFPLQPGAICHILKETPHDFAAAEGEELVMFYSLITTRGER